MVANGYGITLLTQVAAKVEARDERVKLPRFAPPTPKRTVGARVATDIAAQIGPCHARSDRDRCARRAERRFKRQAPREQRVPGGRR
jgi:hypothetical protein